MTRFLIRLEILACLCLVLVSMPPLARTAAQERTATSTKTPTSTRTYTATRTPTVTRSPTNTRTMTSTRTPTRTVMPSYTATMTHTPTTTSTPVDPAQPPAQIDTDGGTQEVIARLRAFGLIPPGGNRVLNVETSFGKTSDSGYSYLPLGRGLALQDGVLQYIVSWNAAGAASGCGLLFRSAFTGGNDTITLITKDGYVRLFHYIGDQTKLLYDQPSSLYTPGDSTVITIIAVGERITLYINGRLETTQQTSGPVIKGGLAIGVYNAKSNRVLTDCRYRNIWAWSFD